jgi:ATP-dependent DNA helicase PIF1
LKLKVGAQVILLKNINAAEGLVNGKIGIVTKFELEKPIVKFSDEVEKKIDRELFTFSLRGRVVAQRKQLPLDLSWGLSVHKSQGMTVDKAIVNLQGIFAHGQGNGSLK